MSRFQVKKVDKSPEEWEAIAFRASAETGLQWKIAFGLVIAAITTAATTPVTGVLVLAYTIYSGLKVAGNSERNQKAVRDYGCVAQILSEQDFQDYVEQVGEAEILKQLSYAESRGWELSPHADEYLEGREHTIKVLPPQAQNTESHVAISRNHNSLVVGSSNTEIIKFERRSPDLVDSVAKDIKNSLFVGVPGVGKDYFVANVLDRVKSTPGSTVFFVDPKDDPKETGYFDGRVDFLYRLNILESTPTDTSAWLAACLREFDSYDPGTGIKLLVLNELAFLNKTLSGVKGALNWLSSKMVGYSSSGDSRGIKLWVITQNVHKADLGLSGGTTSIFTPYVIISESQLSASEQVLRAQIIPSDQRKTSDQLQSFCKDSPVKRAIFHGALNSWYPMPELPNLCGYDRDKRKYLDTRNSKSNSQSAIMIEKLERTTQKTIDDFICEDLKSPERLAELKTAIINLIKQSGHKGLMYKFSEVHHG